VTTTGKLTTILCSSGQTFGYRGTLYRCRNGFLILMTSVGLILELLKNEELKLKCFHQNIATFILIELIFYSFNFILILTMMIYFKRI